MSDNEEMPPLENDVTSNSSDKANSNIDKSNNISNTDNEVKMEDNDDEFDDEEDYVEEACHDNSEMRSLCLFCDKVLEDPCVLFCHMESLHQFSMKSMVCHWTFDQMTYIKFVNYVRKEKPKPVLAIGIKPANFKKEEYLKPVLDNDPLLCFDVDEFYDYTDEEEESGEGDEVTVLKETCEQLREIVNRQREALRRLMEETHGGRELKAVKTVSDIEAEEDEGYFNSYAYFDIHHEMLSDTVRTEAYRDAITKNAHLFSGRRVLDVGCGTGILSLFAAQAGASVVAVDMSEVIFHAMQIVKENGFEDVIDLRKGRLEDIHFNHKFDAIVSEWMGYFLLFEGMLDSVIYARKHYLAPGGWLLPNRCTLHLVGAEDMEAYGKYIDFWKDVYGFKMNCMVKESIKEASTEVVKGEKICTSSCLLRDFDLMKVVPEDTEFSQDFVLTAERDGALTCFVGYFDTYFDLPEAISFSTGPHAPSTHWKQTIFYLPKLRPITKGEELKGTITVRRKKREIRSLDVVINFENRKYHYFVE